MKHLYKTLTATLLFLGVSTVCYSQTTSSVHNLIIQVPGIAASRGMPEIKNKIEALNGVRVYAFCKSQYLIFVKVDKAKQPDDKAIYEALRSLHFNFNVKPEADFEKALSTCSSSELPHNLNPD
jgi:hypothetical protein